MKLKRYKKIWSNIFSRQDKIIKLKGKVPDELSTTQALFIEWNSTRLDISVEESRKRYFSSWYAIAGGHSGKDYKNFNKLSYDIYQVFFQDNKNEIYEAYKHHSYMHFLRMLSYPDNPWEDTHITEKFLKKSKVTIVDYGCGLANRSRALAEYLSNYNIDVELYLVDILTIRGDFLKWIGRAKGINIILLESSAEKPIPSLPECDICFAIDFFEHVHDPVTYFEKIHSVLKGGGLLWADVKDHNSEFMHVSPHLNDVRERLSIYNYKEIIQDSVYIKAS